MKTILNVLLIVIPIIVVSPIVIGFFYPFSINLGPSLDMGNDVSPVEVEIEHFRELINHAVETNDVSICNSLPEPKYEWISGDDWDARTPTQQEWIIFCEALVKQDPLLCEKLEMMRTGSNLDYSCRVQLEK